MTEIVKDGDGGYFKSSKDSIYIKPLNIADNKYYGVQMLKQNTITIDKENIIPISESGDYDVITYIDSGTSDGKFNNTDFPSTQSKDILLSREYPIGATISYDGTTITSTDISETKNIDTKNETDIDTGTRPTTLTYLSIPVNSDNSGFIYSIDKTNKTITVNVPCFGVIGNNIIDETGKKITYKGDDPVWLIYKTSIVSDLPSNIYTYNYLKDQTDISVPTFGCDMIGKDIRCSNMQYYYNNTITIMNPKGKLLTLVGGGFDPFTLKTCECDSIIIYKDYSGIPFDDYKPFTSDTKSSDITKGYFYTLPKSPPAGEYDLSPENMFNVNQTLKFVNFGYV